MMMMMMVKGSEAFIEGCYIVTRSRLPVLRSFLSAQTLSSASTIIIMMMMMMMMMRMMSINDYDDEDCKVKTVLVRSLLSLAVNFTC